MKNFIEGILFIALIIPFSDGILSLFNQTIELICTKIAVKTYQEKQKIQEEVQEEATSSCAIGFQLPQEDEYDDTYEEEE